VIQMATDQEDFNGDTTLYDILAEVGEDPDMVSSFPMWEDMIDTLKKYPAASKHHSAYTGGLYSHTVFVMYYTLKIGKTLFEGDDLRRVVWLAFVHDWGKIRNYELANTGRWRYVRGEVDHTYHILNMSTSPLPDWAYRALVRHHGGWSKDNDGGQEPYTVVLHAADMLACILERSVNNLKKFVFWSKKRRTSS